MRIVNKLKLKTYPSLFKAELLKISMNPSRILIIVQNILFVQMIRIKL
jgi:hypothetical protein